MRFVFVRRGGDEIDPAASAKRQVRGTVLSMAMLPTMLEQDRLRAGWSVGQIAWRLGVGVREYREIEAGARWPGFETWDRICKLYGWPQTFTGPPRG